MEFRPLGRTGVRISQLCFGTMTFGAESDEATSADLYHRCRDVGINFFDTADAYAKGRSEEILGRLMAGERDDLVIASKFANPIRSGDVNAQGASRRHIVQAVEASLHRLGTDRIDLYYVHHPDPRTPLEETLRALDDLVRQGKILYPAISNHPAWQVAKALGISAREELARFEAIQPMYSLLKRKAELELLPLAESEGLAVFPYSPGAAGLLTGKYAGGNIPEQSRLTTKPKYKQRYADDWMPDAVDAFLARAKARGVHPVTLAIAWVASHPGVTAPIVGARNLEQLEPALASVDLVLTPAEREELSTLVPHPGSPTDRTEEVGG